MLISFFSFLFFLLKYDSLSQYFTCLTGRVSEYFAECFQYVIEVINSLDLSCSVTIHAITWRHIILENIMPNIEDL